MIDRPLGLLFFVGIKKSKYILKYFHLGIFMRQEMKKKLRFMI
jgi:hypothetical protein